MKVSSCRVHYSPSSRLYMWYVQVAPASHPFGGASFCVVDCACLFPSSHALQLFHRCSEMSHRIIGRSSGRSRVGVGVGRRCGKPRGSLRDQGYGSLLPRVDVSYMEARLVCNAHSRRVRGHRRHPVSLLAPAVLRVFVFSPSDEPCQDMMVYVNVCVECFEGCWSCRSLSREQGRVASRCVGKKRLRIQGRV